jgi:hypothetical protein
MTSIHLLWRSARLLLTRANGSSRSRKAEQVGVETGVAQKTPAGLKPLVTVVGCTDNPTITVQYNLVDMPRINSASQR